MNQSPWPSACPKVLSTEACLLYDDDATGEKVLNFLSLHPTILSLVKGLKAYRKPTIPASDIASSKSLQDICLGRFTPKSEALAKAWKERGNHCFRFKRYEEALKCYNMMICSSTEPSTRFIGISNKSACYYAMEEHLEAIALDSYCLEHEQNMDEERKAKLEGRLKQSEYALNLQRVVSALRETVLPDPQEYPLVKVTTGQEGGRGLVAAYSINPGESVFGAPVLPYAASLNEDRASLHCYTCFVSLDRYPVIPCEGCGEGFCSPECFSAASYHQYECKCEWNRSAPEMARLGLYLTLKEREDAHGAHDSNTSNLFYSAHPGPADSRSLSEIYGPEISIIQSLFTNESKLPFLTVLIHHMFDAVLLEQLLAPLKLDRLALLRNILRVNSNAFQIVHLIDITTPDGSAVEETQIVGVGFAIYGLPSLLNHSCAPNTTLTYELQSNKLVLRAIEAIPAGSAVFHSYGPIRYDVPLQERHRQLKKRFYFDCRCKACQQDMKAAQKPFQTNQDINSFLISETSKRTDAALVERIKRILMLDNKATSALELADQYVQQNQIDLSTFIARATAFLKCRSDKFALLHQLYNGPDKSEIFTEGSGQIPTMPKVFEIQHEISETFDKIGQCIAMGSDAPDEAADWVLRSIEVLLRWYPYYSREIAMEHEKLASIFWKVATSKTDRLSVETYDKILKVHEDTRDLYRIVFGSHHHVTNALKDKKETIQQLRLNKVLRDKKSRS
jgi:chaperonin cofactor prefoldin